jgi:hypothetical protein
MLARQQEITLLNKDVIIKAKGVFDSSLTLEDFKVLYSKENIKAVKSDRKTNWELGQVSIGIKDVTLS